MSDDEAWKSIDRIRFPVDEWRLVQDRYDGSNLGADETLFALGNGYLGMRGNPEEGRPCVVNGTFINGFHETWPISHAEEAFGFARTGQTIVNVPDTKTIKIYVDDEPLLLSVADLEYFQRSVDFRDGQHRRDLIWRTPSGKRIQVSSTRMISFPERHVAIMQLEVTLLEGDPAPIVISSQILNRQDGLDEYHGQDAAGDKQHDPRKAGKFAGRVLQPEGEDNDERRGRLLRGYRCTNSKMSIAVGIDHTIETDNTYDTFQRHETDLSKQVFRVRATAGKPIKITKVAVYHTSRGVPTQELFDRCYRTLDRVREQRVQHYFDAQRAWLDEF